MPKPKGCKCGAGVICPVHPDRPIRSGAGRPRKLEAVDTDPVDPTIVGDPIPKVDWSKAIPPKPSERPPDPKPRPRVKHRRRPSTPELEAVLSELLVLPAIPARAVLHCDFCMMHFVTEGPKAAHELALLAEEHDELRRVLERLHAAMTAITWASVVGSYLAKPVLHHVAPAPVLEAVGPVLNIPPRPIPQHEHHAPAAAGAEFPQAA